MREESADSAFDRVSAFLADELAFEADSYNAAYIARRVDARVRRTGCDSYAAYLALLRRDEAERAAVLDALSINVTGFFRNPDVWAALRPIITELDERGSRTRAWSVPCSDGREPYSLAMLALDEGVDRGFSVLGSDIDREILARARRGAYRSARTSPLEEELSPLGDASPYVESTGDGVRVRADVRRLVSFDHHDLVRDAPKRGFDLVCCRNLLIYIDRDHKRAVVEHVANAVRDGGYVVLGKTERLPRACRDRFEEVDASSRIYRRV